MKTPFTYFIRFFSFFLFSILIFSGNTFAQAGRLDSSFGVNGIVQSNLLSNEYNGSNTVLVQQDGKIVICGENGNSIGQDGSQGLLLRYNTNGNLDSTFGHNGAVQSPAYTFLQAGLEPNGKIVVDLDSLNSSPGGGFTEELARYNTNGSLDSTFGNKGLVVLDSIGSYFSMIVEKNGKIFLLSYSNGFVSTISRYLINGQIDTGFNHTGSLPLNSGQGNVPVFGVQSAGQIVVAFLAYPVDSVIRFDSIGKRDSTFQYSNKSFSPSTTIAIEADDKVVFASDFPADSTGAFTCLRTNADGSLDTTFNHSGIDTIYNIQGATQLYAMALDKNNNIILTGIYSGDDTYYTNFFTTVKILANGKPDTSFGKNGEADLQIGMSHDYPYSIAVQNDNKILITGTSEIRIYERGNHIATVRYNTDGSLDQSFGSNGIDTPGIQTQTFSSANFLFNAGDGKILVGESGASAESGISVINRYNEDGTIDSSFNQGKPLPSTGSVDVLNDKIIELDPDAFSDSMKIFRYNIDGSPDLSFGSNGHTSTFVNDSTRWYGYFGEGLTPPLIIQPDGKMIIIGSSGFYPNSFYGNMVRFNADGTVDGTFGTNGIATIAFPFYVDKFSLSQQPDGKILVGAGLSEAGSIYTPFYVARLNPNGSLDSGFGTNGIASKLIDSSYTGKRASFILLQPDGKIIQAGYLLFGDSSAAAAAAIAITRYNANGVVDSTFGIKGIVKTHVGAGNVYAIAGALQPDGKILITGYALSPRGYGYNSILIRYLPAGAVDSSFGTNGIISLTIPPAQYFDPGNEANAILLQSDKILIAGYNDYKSQTDLYIARFVNDITLGVINFSSPANTAIVYPNPIHQSATLKYTLSTDENVTIDLFDVNGKLVKRFIADQNQAKGNYTEQLSFDPGISAGNYFLVITNGKQNETVKIIKQ